MIDLSQFEPLPTTTEGLIKLMDDFLNKMIRREIYLDPVVMELAPRIAEFNMDPSSVKTYQDVQDRWGTDRLVGILTCLELKGHITSFQEEKNISGLLTVSTKVSEHGVIYPYWSGLIGLLDSDIRLLRDSVPLLVDYFERLTGILPEYCLVREVFWDNDSPEWYPASMEEVRTFSGMAGMARIHVESLVDKDPPDQVHLIFWLGHHNTEDSIRFVLFNPALMPKS